MDESARQQVQAFIIGVQKGGTTALSSFLSRHPGIQLSSPKELHFFDSEVGVDWRNPDYGRLHRGFDCSRDALRLEATPVTIYWPESLERLRRYNPAARLILLLRHPGQRAFSHWKQEFKKGREALPFAAAIAPEGRARVRAGRNGVHRVYSYVERGFYAAQIERLLSLFPREQVFVLRTDRLWHEPGPVLSEIESFLGLGPFLEGHLEPRYVVPHDTRSIAGATEADFATLLALFEDDIRRTAALTGLDLSDWLDPAYEESMGREPAPAGPA